MNQRVAIADFRGIGVRPHAPILAALAVGWCLSAGAVPAAEPVNFSRDIRPLLSDRCYKCHGPDSAERQTEMRLDQQASALSKRPLESGRPAIVPGESAKSEVFRRITSGDPDLRMPPPDSGKSLSKEEIERIRRWIDEGAGWRKHWSFIRPTRPKPPRVNHEAAVRNPIDRFILRRVESAGLEPAQEARRETLIRRVTFDLTGLPPTPQEVDAFLADKAPRAYERLVDRLLKSPRYGEHFARYWLDAARYGDTHGLHLDNERSIWPYRDWVIRAFNQNMPFDQFTIEQLAGDLLPQPTNSQLVATGFNRCNVTTSEGGAIRREWRVRYAVDRVETTSTVWMGLTTGCAVCHEHKFDPISQAEFYKLFAYFFSFKEDAMDGNKRLHAPFVAVQTPQMAAEKKRLQQQIAELRAQVVARLDGYAYKDPGAAKEKIPTEHEDYVWIDDRAPSGARLQGNSPWQWVERKKHPVYSGKRATRRKAAGLSQHFFEGAPQPLQIGAGDKLFTYVYLDSKDPPQEIMLQFNSDGWEHRALWGKDTIPWGKPKTAGRRRLGPLPEPGKWVRLEVDAATVGLKPGDRVHGWAFTQFGGTVYWDRAGLVTRTLQTQSEFKSLAQWSAVAHAVQPVGLPPQVAGALALEKAKRSPAQVQAIRRYFLENVNPDSRAKIAPLKKQIDTLEKKLKAVEASAPKTLVMADREKPLETYVLIRGQYDREDKEQRVYPGVPSVLPPLPKDAPPNRLGLARWLVSPEHPLTARVIVNRFWQQYFGVGIVKTAEDFGSQGEWPSHPALLDWLAVDFVESGWDVKRLQRLIVLSGTYRQSSAVRPKLLQVDPANRLLARGPRFRLDAEMIRDAALAVSGLLIERIGGKGVKPYQPDGLWRAVGYTGSNTVRFQRDSGDALYRRSLYTFWKRTSPPPGMSIFDAPSREACSVRRSRTTTPQQALLLMNDEQFVEAARKLAERLLLHAKTTDQRIEWGFRLLTARKPDADELKIFREVLKAHQQQFQADTAAAKKLLAVGERAADAKLPPIELAAWTMVANLLMNLDEALTKE